MPDPTPPILAYTNLHHPTLTEPLMRSGPYLVTAFQATLPPICPLCGQPGNDKPEQLRINIVQSFSISILPKTRYVCLNAVFCERHYKTRKCARAISLTLGFVIILLLAAIFYLTKIRNEPSLYALYAAILTALCGLCSGICQVIATRGPHRYRTERDYAVLAGVHPNLLAQLPSLPESP